MRHTVAISDIHLSQLELTDGLWMRYRQAPFITDSDLVAMLDAFRERTRGDEIELVLNGDIFDFDAPWVQDGKTHLPDARRDAETAIFVLRGILRDHAELFATIGKILAENGTVVFVAGNHDVEFVLEEIRLFLRDTLTAAATASGATEARDAIASRILFRSWFYISTDNVLFEHGHQYDETNSCLTIMTPFSRDRKNIAPTFGSLVARYFCARLGYFNPHVEDSYMLSFFGYIKHGIRYYLFSSRSIVATFTRGMSRTLVELIRNRIPEVPEHREENIAAAIQETGVDRARIEEHLALSAPPLDVSLWRSLRTLGIDRLAFGFFVVTLAFIWQRLTHGPTLLAAAFPIAMMIGYVLIVRRQTTLDEVWSNVKNASRELSRIHGTHAVVFGHTHHAAGAWEDGIFYGNTGSWSAAYVDVECTKPLNDRRPLVWLTRKDETSPLTGGLVMWKDGEFTDPSPLPSFGTPNRT